MFRCKTRRTLVRALVATSLFVGLTSAASAATTPSYKVFSANDLGMHCYDRDFSVFSILPLYNVVHAQVLKVGATPTLLTNTQARVTYKAQADALGSINTTSQGKTNFWTYLPALFGVNQPVDTGILGAKMPGATNTPRPFGFYATATREFVAKGIPITGVDDRGRSNPYPLMNVQAFPRTGTTPLASLPVVVPASDEMACGDCHLTGKPAASDPSIAWSNDANPERQYRKNILLVHDARVGTSLFGRQPVLCASCHYSPALDLAGTGPTATQQDKPLLSRAIHGSHASRMPADATQTGPCFTCHPGQKTQCLRGVMSAVGIGCTDCHGTMAAVAADTRTPWVNEPKCQSCHTGDALDNYGGEIVRRTAYADAPDTATPIVAANTRFAEQPDKLYRNSTGHGGVTCEGCHGSTHAVWPSSEPNDNRAAISLQGHDGVIVECGACHGATDLLLTLGGPHGLHGVNSPTWVKGHHDVFERNRAACQSCHGTSGEGTVLSRVKASRSFQVDGSTVRFAKGSDVGCGHCHENPFLGGSHD
jgi:hypothetical protein